MTDTADETAQATVSPKQGTSLKKKTGGILKRSVVAGLRSRPGRFFTASLDKCLNVSENLLDKMQMRKAKKPGIADEQATTAENPNPQVQNSSKSVLPAAYFAINAVIIVFTIPVSTWVVFLKALRRNLKHYIFAGKRPLPEETNKDKQATRRKLTPKKHTNLSSTPSFWNYLPWNYFRLVRKRHVASFAVVFDDEVKNSTLGEKGDAKKRKHDECEEDSSESEFDIDAYVSDEDPDYCPTDDASEDSLEYKSDSSCSADENEVEDLVADNAAIDASLNATGNENTCEEHTQSGLTETGPPEESIESDNQNPGVCSKEDQRESEEGKDQSNEQSESDHGNINEQPGSD